MSKKAKFVEELVEALTDTRVIQALSSTLSTLVENAVKNALGNVTRQLSELEEEQVSQQTQIDELRKENDILRNSIDRLDANTRIQTLIIKGLPDTSYAESASESHSTDQGEKNYVECQKTAVAFFTNQLGISVEMSDISTAYRMPKGRSDLHRPLFVSFSSRRARDSVFFSRTQLKGQNIFINENLTRINSLIFAKARRLAKAKKITKTWSLNGAVFIIVKIGDKPIKVNKLTDFIILGIVDGPE